MILAVIPARGDSKGIPRKNVRLLNGKPLLYYAIKHATECPLIDDVAVTSDDEEILSIARRHGVRAIQRAGELALDTVTLDPVIYDALTWMEQEKGTVYDVVVTLQPTSPLLSVQTLSHALEDFVQSSYDTYISVVNKPHLSWSVGSGGGYKQDYEKRQNRQQLPPRYEETGAFLIARRKCISPGSRIGKKVSVYEMPKQEAVDIDDVSDWLICEQELKKKKILFRADGYKQIGMGHIYHCLTLAYNLIGHEIVFVTKKEHQEGLRKLEEAHMKVKAVINDREYLCFVREWKPDIVVNDCLDTQEDFVKELKKYVKRVVAIEDLGSGADCADVVINALYEDGKRGRSYYWGEKYVCLKDEFFMAKPAVFHKEVRRVVVVFGGTDASGFTGRVYTLAKRLHKDYPRIIFHFILGIGYSCTDGVIGEEIEEGICVERDTRRISDAFMQADLAFTSQGRTVYELASVGVPAIVMAQNERETKHTFAQMHNGFMNLGLGKYVSDETLERTFRWLVETPQIRREMRELMLRHDLTKGIDRVRQLILKEDENE